MTKDTDPMDLAASDLRWWTKKAKQIAHDWTRAHMTLGLFKVTLGGLTAVTLAFIGLPWIAAAAATAAIIALLIYAYYSTQVIKRKDADLRWQLIGNIRLEQKVLELEDAADRAALAIVDGRAQLSRTRPIELRQAVFYLRSRYARENAPEAQRIHRQQAAPQPPDMSQLNQRLLVRAAKLAEGEARIQSLSVPDNVDLLVAAEQAKELARQRQDDASAADRAARANQRMGRRPSPVSAGHAFRIQVGPAGMGAVQQVPPTLTPEQIARGERHDGRAGNNEAA